MQRYAAASHLWRALPVGLADWAWQRRGRLLLARAAREVPAYASLLRVFGDPACADPVPLPTSHRSYVQVYPLEQRARRDWQHQVVSYDLPAAAATAVTDASPPKSPTSHPQSSVLNAQREGTARPAPSAQPPGLSSVFPGCLAWPRARDELQVLRQHLVGLLGEWFDITRRRSLLILALPECGWSGRRRIGQALQSAIAASRLPVTVIDLADTPDLPDPAMPQPSPQVVLQTLCRQAVGCEQVVVLADPASAGTYATTLAHLPVRPGLMVFGPYPHGLAGMLPPEVVSCSVLGADEIGPLIASETLLSRQLASLSRTNRSLSECLLVDGAAPVLYQPLPRGPWLEQAGDDLLATCWGAAPTIRYRLGWRARLIPYSRLCGALRRQKVLPPRQFKRFTRIGSPCWKLPLIAIPSR